MFLWQPDTPSLSVQLVKSVDADIVRFCWRLFRQIAKLTLSRSQADFGFGGGRLVVKPFGMPYGAGIAVKGVDPTAVLAYQFLAVHINQAPTGLR